MKKIVAAILLVALLTVFGCGKQESSTEETEQSSGARKAPAAPSIDLHTAAASGNLAAIRQHIEAGSDLNVKDPKGGACPLSTAALFGQTDAAVALIKAGADVNCRGIDGATPLHVAAFFCRTEIVKALLAGDADKNIRNGYGSTALETVSGPYENVKPIYEHFEKTLGPAGLELDYERIEATRPKIAELLQ